MLRIQDDAKVKGRSPAKPGMTSLQKQLPTPTFRPKTSKRVASATLFPLFSLKNHILASFSRIPILAKHFHTSETFPYQRNIPIPAKSTHLTHTYTQSRAILPRAKPNPLKPPQELTRPASRSHSGPHEPFQADDLVERHLERPIPEGERGIVPVVPEQPDETDHPQRGQEAAPVDPAAVVYAQEPEDPQDAPVLYRALPPGKGVAVVEEVHGDRRRHGVVLLLGVLEEGLEEGLLSIPVGHGQEPLLELLRGYCLFSLFHTVSFFVGCSTRRVTTGPPD